MEPLGELFGMFKGGQMPEAAPLMTFWSGTKWGVWMRGQATYCLRSGIAGVSEEWSQGKRGGGGVNLIPEELALRIGGATKLAAGVASNAVIQREGRWASNASMRYVRANMEDPIWVSEALVEGRGGDRQPGQGTRWGGGRGGAVELDINSRAMKRAFLTGMKTDSGRV